MAFLVGTLTLVLHCRPFPRLFFSVRFLQVSCSALTLVEYFLTRSPLRRVTLAWLIKFLSAANSCCSPHFPWVIDFLKMFLLRHATVARQDTFRSIGVFRATFAWCVVPLQETVNFFWGQQFCGPIWIPLWLSAVLFK
jgi:uncharacterized membrane protein YraQ (UPF0718 family)